MTVKIPIEAGGVGDITAALATIVEQAKKLKAALGDGATLKVDTNAAQGNLDALAASARSVKLALGKLDGTKVAVDAGDVTGALSEAQGAIHDVQKALGGLGDQKVTLDLTDAKKALLDLGVQAAKAIYAKPGQKGPLGAAADDAKRLGETLDRARRATADWITKRTGAAPTPYEAASLHQRFLRRAAHDPFAKGFSDIGAWDAGVGGRFKSSVDAEHYRMQAIARMAGAAGISLPGGPAPHHAGGHGEFSARHLAGIAGGVAGSMIGGGGTGGAFETAGELGGTGLGMGAGAMIGGPAGAVVGALVGAIASKALGGLGAKQDEAMGEGLAHAIETSNLRRRMGEQAVGLHELTEAMDKAAQGLGLTSAEAVKLATEFSREASLVGAKNAAAIGGEMRSQFSFANAYGMPFALATQFFARMRAGGVTTDERSSRVLAVNIADAIGRGGMGARNEEVLQSLSRFVQAATAVAFRAPDASRVASMMATGAALHLPGLEPGVAGGILTEADATFRRGGSYGEASKVLLKTALMREHGIGAFRADELQSGGMFGTPADAFGPKSALMRQAEMRRDAATTSADRARWEAEIEQMRAIAAGPTGRQQSGPLALRFLREQYQDPEQFKAALVNMFGQSPDRAAALDLMLSKDPTGEALRARLQRAGVNTDAMELSGLANMSQIAFGDDKAREAAVKQLEAGKEVTPLSPAEHEMLIGAKGAGGERLVDVLLKLYESRGRGETEGDRARNLQEDIRSATIRMADHLIPLTTSIKEGTFALVEKLAGGTALGSRLARENEFVAAGEDVEKAKKALAGSSFLTRGARTADLLYAQKRFEELGRGLDGDPLTSAAQKAAASLPPVTDAHGAHGEPVGSRAASGVIGGLGGSPLGLRNNNPGNIRATPAGGQRWQGEVGADANGFAIFDSADNGIRALGKNLVASQQMHGNVTIADIVSRWAPSSENDTAAYIADVAKRTGIGPNEVIDVRDKVTMGKLARAIMAHENGVALPYSDKQIESSLDSALQLPQGAPRDTAPAATGGRLKVDLSATIRDALGLPRTDTSFDVDAFYQPIPAGQ